MRISDWSSDVCSSDLIARYGANAAAGDIQLLEIAEGGKVDDGGLLITAGHRHAQTVGACAARDDAGNGPAILQDQRIAARTEGHVAIYAAAEREAVVTVAQIDIAVDRALHHQRIILAGARDGGWALCFDDRVRTECYRFPAAQFDRFDRQRFARGQVDIRSEEHTSELQSLMRISYAVFC